MDFSAHPAARMLSYFEALSRVPRPSGHEGKAADFITSELEKHGVAYTRDGADNVFAVLPATPGREEEDAVLLQGHMDMVCEADDGVEWNVLEEGVSLRLDGDWLKGTGTTLGGDDGFAVAVMLAAASGALPSHPRLELLFTTDEEVGLGGAQAFDCSQVTAKYLVNLDSEDEGEILVSCAGGAHIDLTERFSRMDFDGAALKLTLSGLAGGHSGADIHLGRKNAVTELASVLVKTADATRLNLASFTGGSKDNAIPRFASAVIAVTDVAAAGKAAADAVEALRAVLTPADAEMTFLIERVPAPEKMFSRKDSRLLCDFLSLLPYGVLEKNEEIDTVETSCNVGIVTTGEEDVEIALLARSAAKKKLDNLLYVIEMLCISYGAEMEVRSRYPAWDYLPGSRLCAAYAAAYEELHGKKLKVCGIHAGLECGIFKEKLPDLDIISLGADIPDVHTPRERMSLSSCDRIWQALALLFSRKI